jgi:hypothetical protein
MEESAMDYDNYPEVDEIRKDLAAAVEEGGDVKVYNNLWCHRPSRYPIESVFVEQRHEADQVERFQPRRVYVVG